MFRKSTKNHFIDILHWASKQPNGFTINQLFKKFNNLDKDWFLKVFRGANNDNDNLIGILRYDEKENTYYYHLTAKGMLEFSQLQNSKPKKNNWWEKSWIQIIVFLGAVAGIVSLWALFKN